MTKKGREKWKKMKKKKNKLEKEKNGERTTGIKAN